MRRQKMGGTARERASEAHLWVGDKRTDAFEMTRFNKDEH